MTTSCDSRRDGHDGLCVLPRAVTLTTEHEPVCVCLGLVNSTHTLCRRVLDSQDSIEVDIRNLGQESPFALSNVDVPAPDSPTLEGAEELARKMEEFVERGTPTVEERKGQALGLSQTIENIVARYTPPISDVHPSTRSVAVPPRSSLANGTIPLRSEFTRTTANISELNLTPLGQSHFGLPAKGVEGTSLPAPSQTALAHAPEEREGEQMYSRLFVQQLQEKHEAQVADLKEAASRLVALKEEEMMTLLKVTARLPGVLMCLSA